MQNLTSYLTLDGWKKDLDETVGHINSRVPMAIEMGVGYLCLLGSVAFMSNDNLKTGIALAVPSILSGYLVSQRSDEVKNVRPKRLSEKEYWEICLNASSNYFNEEMEFNEFLLKNRK